LLLSVKLKSNVITFRTYEGGNNIADIHCRVFMPCIVKPVAIETYTTFIVPINKRVY
jgi:hypothetical protein